MDALYSRNKKRLSTIGGGYFLHVFLQRARKRTHYIVEIKKVECNRWSIIVARIFMESTVVAPNLVIKKESC